MSWHRVVGVTSESCIRSPRRLVCGAAAWLACLTATAPLVCDVPAANAAEREVAPRGIYGVFGLPEKGSPGRLLELARRGDMRVYFQSASGTELRAVREAAAEAGLLGTRIFAEEGDLVALHLADNLLDGAWVMPTARDLVRREELLRVLHPGGEADLGDEVLRKPANKGVDGWDHVFHGPDNNPQSQDRVARAPYLTQFLADPLVCPMPEVTVAANGRIYKAFGHIAHKANQNAMLNTLLCINAYNGTILWQRPLNPGFMIHRNTMLATADALYLGDQQSCKVIDGATGQLRDEIVIPAGVGDGPVWKWMAMQEGVLYALVGGQEIRVDTQTSDVPGLGHWPWGMWQGHEYADPRTNFGFGRTVVAIDSRTKRMLWQHQEEQYIDSRGVCMGRGRIYLYSPDKFLACVAASDGQTVWKNADKNLLEAIGPNGRAQIWMTGYATTNFIKCNDEYIFLAGPQRPRTVVASAADGRLVWTHPQGNLQLVLRPDAIYGAGPQDRYGEKLDYATGRVLGQIPARRACTRATGTADSIFYRATGGTVRIDLTSNTPQHIAPMRPPCQDGVIVSDGLLFWGPWMCGCQLSLYGHIALAPGREFAERPADRQLVRADHAEQVEPFPSQPGDWPAYLGDNRRSGSSRVRPGTQCAAEWTTAVCESSILPTAPVCVHGVTFVADRRGVVKAIDNAGQTKWQTYTGAAVYVAPAVADGRVFVGSADGRVYAFEAATGRRLWSYHVAPRQRWLPVYGRLHSTWPVAGGVVVDRGVVYAAAGITHYDGTHVVALDAATGEPKWRNDTSGRLSDKANSGVSLQGELCLADGELRFLGGGIYEWARYDVRDGKCRNEPFHGVNSTYHTAFYAYYPDYGKYVSLDHTLADGRKLMHEASYEGSRFTNLALYAPARGGQPVPASRWYRPQANAPRTKPLWVDEAGRRFTSLIVTPELLLAAVEGSGGEPSSITAIRIADGTDAWQVKLPAAAVKGGMALDGNRRIVVSLQNGQLVSFRTYD